MEPNDFSALVLGPAGRALAAVVGAPRLSAASAAPLREIAAGDEHGGTQSLYLPIERPLTLVLDGRETVTLLTLGAAPEWLALGYLANQRLIEDVSEIRSIEVDWSRGLAHILRHAEDGPLSSGGNPGREPGAALGCGLGTAFGDGLRRFDALAPVSAATLSQTVLFRVLDSMRQHDAIHRAAGSVHSCALFQAGELCVAVEDVSRHNGVDIITGFMRLFAVDGSDKMLFTTGRLTAEMVMKAAHNGIPVMISRNGATALGYEMAGKLGMTLIGRAGKGRYLCYVGAERIVRDAPGVS
jgi:FdhD protein